MTDRDSTVEVPFVQIGNRRGLTREQLEENPWLLDFYKRFQHCFELHHSMDAVVFIEPELAERAPPAEGLSLTSKQEGV
jgi:hypothetical protein